MPPKAWTKYRNYDRNFVLNRRWQHEIRRTKQTERQLQGKAKDMGWRKQRITLTRQQGVMDEYIETVGEVGEDFGLKVIRRSTTRPSWGSGALSTRKWGRVLTETVSICQMSAHIMFIRAHGLVKFFCYVHSVMRLGWWYAVHMNHGNKQTTDREMTGKVSRSVGRSVGR